MLSFKTYLTEEKKKKKKQREESKHYNKVFMGKSDIEADETKKNYNKVFMGKKKIDEDILPEPHIGRPSGAIETLHKKLSRHYKFGKKLKLREEPKLDDPHGDEKVGIRRYTGIAYKHINKALYKGDTSLLLPEHQDAMQQVMGAQRRHKTPVAMTVHTGIKRDPRQMEKHEGQIKMEMPAFTSTSLDVDQAKEFARPSNEGTGNPNTYENHVVHIDVPKGSHGVYVAHHSQMPDEKEFILHPGARVHLHPEPTHVEEKDDGWGDTTRTYHWRGKLVHDGVKDV
jgi:hypothetical protein